MIEGCPVILLSFMCAQRAQCAHINESNITGQPSISYSLPKRVTTPATGCKRTCLASLLEVRTPHTISKTKPATLGRGRTQPQLHLQRSGASSTNCTKALKPLHHQHRVRVQGQCAPAVGWKPLSFNATCTVLGPKKVRPSQRGLTYEAWSCCSSIMDSAKTIVTSCLK